MTAPLSPRAALAAVLILAVWLGGRGLTDPASVMLSADMSRYMMNGAFVYDLIRDGGVWSYAELTRYAEHYFARYPALTLGHHPPVPYLAVVPFYAVFGVSVLAARLAALSWFLLAVWSLFRLGTKLYDWRVGAFAAALFATNVMALRAGQHLLSEMPMVALVLVATNALVGWRETRRARQLGLFVVAATASVYAKQLAALMLPTYAAILLGTLGWRGIANRRGALVAGGAALLAFPMTAMSAGLGPANVSLVMTNLRQLVDGTREVSLPALVGRIVTTHLSWAATVVMLTAAAVMAVRRRRATATAIAWIVSVVFSTAAIAYTFEPARYAFGALPAYYLLMASLLEAPRTRVTRAIAIGVLSLLLVWQIWSVRSVWPSGAGGYEAAAQYVVTHSQQPTVLYHAISDTGYFVFFTRRHDEARRLVVQRGEKLLTPPQAGDATTPDELAALLRRQGVHYVVVEEREAETPVLRLLHAELRSPRFAERQRLPIVTREPGARGRDLVVYEFLEAGPPAPDAEVSIGVWRADRQITVPMRALTAEGAR
jgi:hypothetical protein